MNGWFGISWAMDTKLRETKRLKSRRPSSDIIVDGDAIARKS